MKKLILLSTMFLILNACAGTTSNDQLTKDVNMLAGNMAGMQDTVAQLQTEVEELSLKNDLLAVELNQKKTAINDLETEVTYLSGELAILKNPRGATSVTTAQPTVGVKPVTSTPEAVRAPKIVIVDDVKPMKDTLYNYAYELYRQGKYTESVAKFQEFITKMPNDDLANNSQYWIGENYYSMKDYTKANDEFQKVLTKYPKGGKVPDAMLKMAYCQKNLGQDAKASETLNSVIKTYPNSSAANLARQNLAKWK